MGLGVAQAAWTIYCVFCFHLTEEILWFLLATWYCSTPSTLYSVTSTRDKI